MAKRQKRSSSGFLMGLVIGIAVGATVVWVLTPQPREIEEMRAAKVPANPGAGDSSNSENGANAGTNATIMDLAMAAVERVRDRFSDAVALGREAYEQGQTEVMQRFNQGRATE